MDAALHATGLVLDVVDDTTVVLKTSKPFPALRNSLAHPNAGLLSPDADKKLGDGYGVQPVSCGPYAFKEWQRGSHIKVDLLAHGLPLVLRRVMNAFAWAVLLGFTVLLCWKIGERVQSAVSGGDVTMDLRLPHWVFFLAIWLGMLAALFTTGLRLWLIVARGRGLGEYDGIETHLDTPGEPK